MCDAVSRVILYVIWFEIEVELSRIAAEASSQTQFVSLQLLAGSKDTALQPLAKMFHIAVTLSSEAIGEDHNGDENDQRIGTM